MTQDDTPEDGLDHLAKQIADDIDAKTVAEVSVANISKATEETPIEQPVIDARKHASTGMRLFEDEYSGIGGEYVIDPNTGKRVPDTRYER